MKIHVVFLIDAGENVAVERVERGILAVLAGVVTGAAGRPVTVEARWRWRRGVAELEVGHVVEETCF